MFILEGRSIDCLREITREPMTEEIPCEYCQQTFPSTDLNRHQVCVSSPDRVLLHVLRRSVVKKIRRIDERDEEKQQRSETNLSIAIHQDRRETLHCQQYLAEPIDRHWSNRRRMDILRVKELLIIRRMCS